MARCCVVLLLVAVPLTRALMCGGSPSRPGVMLFSAAGETTSPFAFADVVGPESDAPSEKEAPSLAAQLEMLEAKKVETVEKTQAARARAKEARVEASRLLARAAAFRSGSPNAAAADIVAEAEAEAASLRAEEKDAKARTLVLTRSRPATVAEAKRLAKTELSAVQEATVAMQRDLESLRLEDTTLVEEEQRRIDRQIADAEARADFTVDLGVVEPRLAVPTAGLAGLLFADFIGLEDAAVFLAAAFCALMLAALPPSDILPSSSKKQ